MSGCSMVIYWCVPSPGWRSKPVFTGRRPLQVGHDPESLTADRTLDSLYVQPLLNILKSQNPDTIYTEAAPQHIK